MSLDRLQILHDFLVVFLLVHEHVVKCLFDVAQDLRSFIVIFWQEGCDEVSDIISVINWLNVGVIKHESKMALDLGHSFYLMVFTECLSHDSDQHIEKMEAKEKGSQEEQEPQKESLRSIS